MITGTATTPLIAAALVLLPSLAVADPIAEPEALLSQRGVKLVAIEFGARWCPGCVASAPRWEALRQGHRADGLRVVVVAVRDPACSAADWTADQVICDLDGALAARFGVERIPSAFLLSWDGRTLVSRGEVEEVERGVERWLHERPRVAVSVVSSGGVSPEALEGLVRAELVEEGKLEVVATAAERRRLHRLARRSFAASFDERLQCELGQEVPANSLLEVSVVGGDLVLQLLSAERGCLISSSIRPWDRSDVAGSVRDAVAGMGRATPERRRARPRPASRHARAKAAFDRIQPRFEAYRRLEVTLEQRALKDKADAAEALAREYRGVMEHGDPRLGVAARVRIAEIYLDFAEGIRGAPLPDGVTDRAELDAIARGPEQRAKEALDEGLVLARRRGVRGLWRNRLEDQLERLSAEAARRQSRSRPRSGTQ